MSHILVKELLVENEANRKRIAELEALVAALRNGHALKDSDIAHYEGEKDKRIAELEADCADMAIDVIAEADQRYSDGEGGIHPALLSKYECSISTARKYAKAKEEA